MTTPSTAGKGPQPRPCKPSAYDVGYQRIRGFRQNSLLLEGPCPICWQPGCAWFPEERESPYDMDDIDIQDDDYDPMPNAAGVATAPRTQP